MNLSCETCCFMRREGQVMRCYYDPPQAVLLGTVPAKIQGAPPMLVIGGITPETHPQRFCRHHPTLEPVPKLMLAASEEIMPEMENFSPKVSRH